MKLSDIKTFLKESRLEFKHVNWLTKKQATQYTIIVIGLSLGLSIFLGVFDFVFNLLLTKFVI
jgi:preprotein translocase SecE subunit